MKKRMPHRTALLLGFAWSLLAQSCSDGARPTPSPPASWLRSLREGHIRHMVDDACMEAVAWRWRDFYPEDTARSEDLWVVAGLLIAMAQEGPEAFRVEGSYGYLAVLATPQVAAGEVVAQWDLQAQAHGVFVDPDSDAQDAELAQEPDLFYRWPGGPSDLSDFVPSGYRVFEEGHSYGEDQVWIARSLEAGVAARAWAFNYAGSHFPKGTYILGAREARVALRYASGVEPGTGRAYKYCDLTGDEVLTNDAGYRWCLPDCQLVLPDPAGAPDVPGPTPSTHLLRDAAGDLLIPICPDDFATDWAGGPPQL